ncbi:MAG: hypothetical protein ACERKK_12670, partial [Poseidonibacter sp.]|uniref:hypothetical protein n=1 Tax=Poseidonibacter sp. TaxID=2321188 RepID=UPI00359D0EC2
FVFNSTLIKDNVTINEEIPFNENDLVQHNTFGLGKVIHVIEDGDYYRLTINFDGAQKDILSSFVNKV